MCPKDTDAPAWKIKCKLLMLYTDKEELTDGQG